MVLLSVLLCWIASVHTVLTTGPCSKASKTACCSRGVPAIDEKGEQVSCVRGSSTSCPEAYFCSTNEEDRWAVCCPAEEVTPEPCSTSSDTSCCTHGSPFTDGNGQEMTCGRGSSISCPHGYSCFINKADKWSVCCPSEQTVYGAAPAGYRGLRLHTVCWHVDPVCAQMTYEKISGMWYRGCDSPKPGCGTG